MKILVTGGAGFIGSHVVDYYLEKGFDVVVVDNLLSGKRENVNKMAKFYKIDITNIKTLKKVFEKEKPEIVNHHAAFNNFPKSFDNPYIDLKINIVGTLNIIKESIKNKVKKIIYASSGGLTYGDKAKLPIKEDHPLNPLGPYAISKLASEFYIKCYCENFGIDYTIFRYANVYGPRQDASKEVGIIAIIIDKVLKNQDVTIRGSGNQTRDFIYVKDVVDANYKALYRGDNEIFNIGSGVETSIKELFELIKNIMNKPNIKLYHKEAFVGDERRCKFDVSKAKKILKWKPKYSLEKGLKETINYYSKSD